MPRFKIVTVVGARPQFIKAAPLSAALARDDAIEEISIHTGQHFDENMSDIFFREFAIPPPAIRLDLHSGTHGEMTGKMLSAVEQILIETRPSAVLVYGDTNSTLAGALAASKLVIPVVHVEAGLRSFNRRMPEEINRVLTDHVSDLLLCPSRQSVRNLTREGIVRNVHHVGDIMHDAALQMIPVAERHSNILARLGLAPGQYAVATVHRAENTEPEAMRRVFDFLAERALQRNIILPLHPRTRKAAKEFGIDLQVPGLLAIEPLGYFDMCRLLHQAAEVLTDSGGVQKEAYFHRVPCITLRTETEWIETVEHGWNRLWITPDYQERSEIDDYGPGNATERIVDAIRNFLS